jgi:hypothetical protein
MATYKYENFKHWFDEPEDYGLRSERFYYFVNDQDKYANIERWIKAAFDAGREQNIADNKQNT